MSLTQISYSTLDSDLKARLDAVQQLSSGSTDNLSFTLNADVTSKSLPAANNTQLIFTGASNAGRISWNSSLGRLQFSNDGITFHNLIESSGVTDGTGISVTQTGSPSQYVISIDGTVLTQDHNSESAETVHQGIINSITAKDSLGIDKAPGLAHGTVYLKDGNGITITHTQISPTNNTFTIDSTGVSGLKSSTEGSYLTGDINLTNNSPSTGISITHVSPTEIQIQSNAISANGFQKYPGVIDFVDSQTVLVEDTPSSSISFTTQNIDVNTSGTPLVGIVDFQDSPSIEVQNPSASNIRLVSKAVQVNGVNLTPGQVNLKTTGSVTVSNTGNDIEFTATGTASLQVNGGSAIVGLTNLKDSTDIQVVQTGPNEVQFFVIGGGGSTILGGKILLVDPAHPDAVDDTDRSTPFDTIQQAINESNAGDCIWIAPGTYTENIIIATKDLQLKSVSGSKYPQDAETKIIGNFQITECNVELDSLHLQASSVTETLNIDDNSATQTRVSLRSCSITNTNASGKSIVATGSLTRVYLYNVSTSGEYQLTGSALSEVRESVLNTGASSSLVAVSANQSKIQSYDSQIYGDIELISNTTSLTQPIFNNCLIYGHFLLTDISNPLFPAIVNQCLIKTEADGSATIKALDNPGLSVIRIINTDINCGWTVYAEKEASGTLLIQYNNLILSSTGDTVESGVGLTSIPVEAFDNVTIRQDYYNNPGELRFKELDTNGTNYVGFRAPTGLTGTQIWELPGQDGSLGEVLTTDGAGVLSWSSPSASFSWIEVVGVSQTCAVNTGYIANNGSVVQFTLPATCAVGDVIEICGKGVGGWRVNPAAGQQIHFGNTTTTPGTGYLEYTHRRDAVKLLCTLANTEFTVLSAVGNISVT